MSLPACWSESMGGGWGHEVDEEQEEKALHDGHPGRGKDGEGRGPHE